MILVKYNFSDLTIETSVCNLTQHGYFKYNISRDSGYNRLIVRGNSYYPVSLYLVKQFCIIENKTANGSVFYFMIPLESSWFVSKTKLDPLFHDGIPENLNLNNMLPNDSKCLVTSNTIRLANSISVPFVFPTNMRTIQEINDLSRHLSLEYPQLSVATIVDMKTGKIVEGLENPTQANNKISDFSQKSMQDVNNFWNSPANSNIRDFSQKINSMVGDLDANENPNPNPNPKTCTGGTFRVSDIGAPEIAMVPIDSDYLNGVYEISLIRMFNDFFIFIMAILFSYFFLVPMYNVLFIETVRKYFVDDNRRVILTSLDNVCILGALILSIFLIIDANMQRPYDTIEMAMGASIFLLTMSTKIFIMMDTLKLRQGNDYDFLKSEFTLMDLIGKNDAMFMIWLFSSLLVGVAIGCILLYVIQKNMHWSIILVSIGSSLLGGVLSFLIYVNFTRKDITTSEASSRNLKLDV